MPIPNPYAAPVPLCPELLMLSPSDPATFHCAPDSVLWSHFYHQPRESPSPSLSISHFQSLPHSLKLYRSTIKSLLFNKFVIYAMLWKKKKKSVKTNQIVLLTLFCFGMTYRTERSQPRTSVPKHRPVLISANEMETMWHLDIYI